MGWSVEKIPWLERAKETHNFHCAKIKEDPKWRLQNTAKALNRSLGSISQDLLIASWMKTHRPQLERFEFAKDALEYIRKKQKSFEEID